MINNNRSRFGGDLVDFNRRFDAFRTDLGDNPFMRQPSSSRASLNQAVFGPIPSNDPVSIASLSSNPTGLSYPGLDRRFTDTRPKYLIFL